MLRQQLPQRNSAARARTGGEGEGGEGEGGEGGEGEAFRGCLWKE